MLGFVLRCFDLKYNIYITGKIMNLSSLSNGIVQSY